MSLRWAHARFVKGQVRHDAGFTKPLVLPVPPVLAVHMPHAGSRGHPCMRVSCAACLLHNTLTSSGGSSTATEKAAGGPSSARGKGRVGLEESNAGKRAASGKLAAVGGLPSTLMFAAGRGNEEVC